jgi:glycosyltransferase involved in cell wall biosynthesis
MELLGAFESTYQPTHDVDVAESTGHIRHWREDLDLLASGFDVALMPFARNEATRSISPTKTLEYLAAGLPVVSTRVADVVADYGHVVALADDAPGFAEECVRLLDERSASRPDVDAALHRQHWDTIAASMEALMTRHLVTPDRTEASA